MTAPAPLFANVGDVCCIVCRYVFSSIPTPDYPDLPIVVHCPAETRSLPAQLARLTWWPYRGPFGVLSRDVLDRVGWDRWCEHDRTLRTRKSA